MASLAMYLIVATTAFFTLGFSILWRRNKSQTYVLGFMACYGFACLGMFISKLSPDPGSLATLTLVRTAGILSTLGLVWGASARAGLRFPWWIYISILVVGAATWIAVTMVGDTSAQMYIVHMNAALCFALVAMALSKSGRQDPLDRAIAWLFALNSAQYFMRPLLAVILAGELNPEAVQNSSASTVFMLTSVALSTSLALTLLVAVLIDQLRDTRRKAEVDELSGLNARCALEADASKLVEQSAKEHRPLSLIVADIDNLRQMNEVLGYQRGDAAIQALGRLIEKTVRDSDVSGRIGGGTFCILACNCEKDAAQDLAQRINKAFAELPQESEIGAISWSASFGIAVCTSDDSFESLFSRARTALCATKNFEGNKTGPLNATSKREAGRTAVDQQWPKVRAS